MKTLIVQPSGELSIQEIAMPSYSKYQALVKTVSCGVCNGTDGKLIHRTFKGFAQDVYPVTLGHEAVGRVIEIGECVTSYKVGDHVLLPFPGEIDGITPAWGAFAEYGVVDDAAALQAAGIAPDTDCFPESAFGQNIVPPEIDPVDAAMIITLREVMSGIKYFGMQANDSVVVYGCGPVGLTYIKFLSLLGVYPIIAVDIIDSKLEDALSRGATYALNSKTSDVRSEVRKILPDGAKYVLDAVGVSALINEAMELICDRGKICCYGISANCNMQLDWSKAPYNWSLCFQQFPSKKEEGDAHQQILAWLKAGVIDLKDYISDIVDFKDVLSAFEKLERKEITKKCIIKYE